MVALLCFALLVEGKVQYRGGKELGGEGRSSMAPVGLPPGFRFHPTDEELVSYYLKRKVQGLGIELDIIPEVDLYKCEPWELAEKSFLPSREPEWYFFGPRDRKYPNGLRTNRATRAGYWKSTGKDRRVSGGRERERAVLGMKKTLVYYLGRAPQGVRTDWVMHEYRLDDRDSDDAMAAAVQDSFALCRVFKKNAVPAEVDQDQGQLSNSSSSNTTNYLPSIENATYPGDQTPSPVTIPVESASPCADEDDKDDSWMQFITDDDAWCSEVPGGGGAEGSPCIAFAT